MTSQRRHKRAFTLPSSRERIDADVQAELAFHIQERIDQFVAEGMTRENAEREVEQRFGDYETHRAHTLAIDADTLQRRRRADRLRDIGRELRLAVRSLLRTPSFTLVVVLTLALGVGATTGIFSVLDAVVLRPLPYHNAAELVSVLHPATVPGSGERAWGVSPGGYFQFSQKNHSLSSFALYRSGWLTVTNSNLAEQVQISAVTASVFTVLAARPFAGRLLTAADDLPGGPLVAVLSYEFLQRRFGGDLSILGKNLETSAGPFQIIGITQPGLTLPMPGPFASATDLSGFAVDVWTPMQLNPAGPFHNNHPNVGIGRLKSGRTAEQAQADFAAIFSRFTETLPTAYSVKFITSYNFRVRVEALQRTVLGPSLPRTLWMLLGAVCLVLAIAAANVANLYLVRLDVRRRESAVRSALGADRLQMATHYLAETLLLCVVAAIIGLGVAALGLKAMRLVAPADIPRLAAVSLDTRAAMVAVGLSLLLGLALGVLPLARRAVDLDALRSASRGQSTSPRQRFVQSALVVGQLAMALMLLAAAGLMLRSFRELRAVKPGFRTTNVLAFDVSLPYNDFKKRSATLAFHRELQRRLRELPGVVEVGSIGTLPLEGYATGCTTVFREGRPYGPGEQTPCVSTGSASPGALEALGVVVHGRIPSWQDIDARTQAVVVTKALAERLWPGESAIGKGIGSNGPDANAWYRVVGVTTDLRAEALDAASTEAVFYAMTGLSEDDQNGDLNDRSYVVRTGGGDPMSLIPAIRQRLADMSGLVPMIAPRTMDAVLQRSMSRTTFLTALLGTAAMMALILSAVGIYGVISYVVSQRRSEIGIRMALGASVQQVVSMVLMQSVRLAVVGIAVGLVGAYAVSRALQSLLFGVRGADPVVLVVVVAVLFATTIAASLIPSRRAARVDPSEAMRAG